MDGVISEDHIARSIRIYVQQVRLYWTLFYVSLIGSAILTVFLIVLFVMLGFNKGITSEGFLKAVPVLAPLILPGLTFATCFKQLDNIFNLKLKISQLTEAKDEAAKIAARDEDMDDETRDSVQLKALNLMQMILQGN